MEGFNKFTLQDDSVSVASDRTIVPHKLLPARTPEGVKVEGWVKRIYKAEQEKDFTELAILWQQIAIVAEDETRRSLFRAFPDSHL